MGSDPVQALGRCLARTSLKRASAKLQHFPRRLEMVGPSVRQGQSLSTALGDVKAIPNSIIRLAALGEASGSLGPMLIRAGKLEEDGAMKRIHVLGQLAGPALIVLLGALLGLLMAGLLSGISQMGQSTLR